MAADFLADLTDDRLAADFLTDVTDVRLAADFLTDVTDVISCPFDSELYKSCRGGFSPKIVK